MKGMQKISRGSGFNGVLSYALRENARIVGGNMSGYNVQSLSSEFAQTRSVRQDIRKPVWHSSLRLQKDEKITDEKWSEIASDYMKDMGFSESHLYTAILHDDTEGQHIHIIASRIALDKSLFYGRNENLISTRIIHDLERKHNLSITRGLKYIETINEETNEKTYKIATKSEANKLKKNEIEKAIRTNEAPTKLILQHAIDAVLSSDKSVSVSAFIEQLNASNVIVKPAVASTGRLNGFTFALKEDSLIFFKGSEIGKSYSVQNLIKRGLSYDKDRDSQAISAATISALNASDTLRSSDSRSDDTSSTSNADTERAIIAADSELRKESRTEDDTRISSAHISTEDEQTRHEQLDNRDANSNNRTQTTTENIEQITYKKDDANDSLAKYERWRSVADDITNIAAASFTDTSKNEHITEAQKKAKVKAVTRQLDALDAQAYRLTLVSRDDDKKSFNVGKSKSSENEKTERFYTKDEVIAQIPFLSKKNVEKYDIYVTPIDKNHHYILVDDMRHDAMLELQSKEQIKPCLIQQTSDDNYQAVIKIHKEINNLSEKQEQSAANLLVKKLNQKYGDEQLTGVIHPFRLAGFSNRKKGRKNAFTTLVLALNRICSVSVQMLENIRNTLKTNSTQFNQKQVHVEQSEHMLHKSVKKNDIKIEKTIAISSVNQKHLAIYQNIVKKANNFNDLDYSVIDFRFARALVAAGAPPREIASSLSVLSPDIATRHAADTHAYISRTIEAAERERETKVTKVRDRQVMR